MTKRDLTLGKRDNFLPAAACSKEMADRLLAVAKKRRVSRAAIIREAVDFYLNHLAQK